jgi:CheY-like chemotaxis protein
VVVLVVEDEPEIAEVLGVILGLQGIRVLTAGDGEQALERLSQQRVDLILCDVVMPRLRGDVLCQRLKADPATAHLPVVLVSGLLPEQMQDGHADGYLRKPFALAQVQALVNQLLL